MLNNIKRMCRSEYFTAVALFAVITGLGVAIRLAEPEPIRAKPVTVCIPVATARNVVL